MSYKPISGIPFATGGRPDGRERISCVLGGMLSGEFLYDPRDPVSKDAALRAFDEYAIGLRNQIETNLGRRLTEKEIFRGVEHVEDEDEFARRKVKAEYDAMFAPAVDGRNWAERLRDEHKAQQKRERDPKAAWLDEQCERLAAEEAARQEKAKRDADPRRKKCIDDATATRLAAIFDPALPMSEIRAADHRLRVAKEGDVKVYAAQKNEFQERHETRLLEQSRPAMETFQTWGQRLKQVRTRFELPAVTIEYEPGQKIDLVAEGKRLGLDTTGLFAPAAEPQHHGESQQ